jgi:hypothetical protein
VYVRIGGRTSSGIARYVRYQDMTSEPVSGSTGASCPGSGKNTLTYWSGAPAGTSRKLSAAKVARTMCGVTGRIALTRARW